MSVKAAIKRARKLVKERTNQQGKHTNQMLVVTEFSGELEGRLVVILSTEDI